MADPGSEHSPEAYRLLFGLVGGGMLLVSLVFILASALVIPVWVVAVLVAIWALGAFLAVSGFRTRAWLPLAAGTAIAVVWLVVLTVGTAVFDWKP